MLRSRHTLVLVLGLVGHLLLQAIPAWRSIEKAPSARDFASYYYAVQVAEAGGDPYDTETMEKLARSERTRKQVHPFFYPPPFLVAMSWVAPFKLFSAYKAMFVLNEVLLFGCLGASMLFFGVPSWAIALLLWTWSPIPDNVWMGQANLLALLPALVGLGLAAKRPGLAGALVGTAAMLKMSPALFLLHWAIQRRWRAVGAAVGAAVAWSIVALPWAGIAEQSRFYLEILPGFGKGDYHGLTVPISLPANHSIPDLADRLFPNPGRLLSDQARYASLGLTAVLLAAWAARARIAQHESAILGALTVLMVAIPVYTYEHHLVFLLATVGIAAGLVQRAAAMDKAAQRPYRAAARWITLALCWFFLAWPLPWLRGAQATFPTEWGWAFRESKTMAEAGLFLLLLVHARSPSAQGGAPNPTTDAGEKA